MKDCIENDVRLKSPNEALSADYGGSRSSAIELMCESCFGGSRSEASKCKSYTCPLWKFRPGGSKHDVVPKGHIPSKEDLEEAIRKIPISEARKAWGAKLGAMKRKDKE